MLAVPFAPQLPSFDYLQLATDLFGGCVSRARHVSVLPAECRPIRVEPGRVRTCPAGTWPCLTIRYSRQCRSFLSWQAIVVHARAASPSCRLPETISSSVGRIGLGSRVRRTRARLRWRGTQPPPRMARNGFRVRHRPPPVAAAQNYSPEPSTKRSACREDGRHSHGVTSWSYMRARPARTRARSSFNFFARHS